MSYFDAWRSRSWESLASRLRSVLLAQVVAVRHGVGHLRPSDRQRARIGRRQVDRRRARRAWFPVR